VQCLWNDALVSLHRLGWLGVRTERFDEMVALFEDALELEPFRPTKSPLAIASVTGPSFTCTARPTRTTNSSGAPRS
jgi:hypothetical protein